MRASAVAIAFLAFLAAGDGAALAQSSSGRWVAENGEDVALTLEERAGAVTGTLSGEGGEDSLPVTGQRTGTSLAGEIGGLPFRATIDGDAMQLDVDGDAIVLRRARSSQSSATASTQRTAQVPAAPKAGSVVVNGAVLSAEELARIQREYGLKIPEAKLWYDARSGAWGAQGGPTAGFVAPALRLGSGALRPDASGGGTGVFVNGREAHAWDVLLMMQLFQSQILPARYFLLADGTAGFEGGPPQWNLLALAQAAPSGGGAGGGGNTWNSRLSSGFGDGERGAVFLPNGGIVSHGF